MTTEAKVEDIPAIVENEASRRAEGVAAVAAAQVDQAQKDAEAIARAAQQSELGSRLSRIEEETTQWRASMDQRLAETQAQTAAALEAAKASILEALSPKLPPPPPPPPPAEVSVSDEQERNSKPPDTMKEKKPEEKPPASQQRLRRAI